MPDYPDKAHPPLGICTTILCVLNVSLTHHSSNLFTGVQQRDSIHRYYAMSAVLANLFCFCDVMFCLDRFK